MKCLAFGSILLAGLALVAEELRTAPVITRIYTGTDGQTHAEAVVTKFGAPVNLREQSETRNVANSHFVRFAPGRVDNWHPASARRYLITLTGRGEVEIFGGQKIPLEPGRILQVEDLTGQGHITRTIGQTDWTVLEVQFGE